MTELVPEALVQPEVPEIGTEVKVEPTELLERGKWDGIDIYRISPMSDFPPEWEFKLQAPSEDNLSLGDPVWAWIRKVNPNAEVVEASRRLRDLGFDTMRDRYLEASEMLMNQYLYDSPKIDEIDIETLGEARGMLTRCIKKDQHDWYTVYYLLGKPPYSDMKRGLSAFGRLKQGVKSEDTREVAGALKQLEDYGIAQRYRNFIRRVNLGGEYAALSQDELIRRIHRIDPHDFEYFIAEVLNRDGWSAHVTEDKYQEKRGIDVIASKDTPFGEKLAIQLKRYDPDTKRHGTTTVRSYDNIHKYVEGADMSAIISTAEFTDDAEALAAETGVKLVDGAEIAEFIDKTGAYDVIDEYLV